MNAGSLAEWLIALDSIKTNLQQWFPIFCSYQSIYQCVLQQIQRQSYNVFFLSVCGVGDAEYIYATMSQEYCVVENDDGINVVSYREANLREDEKHFKKKQQQGLEVVLTLVVP